MKFTDKKMQELFGAVLILTADLRQAACDNTALSEFYKKADELHEYEKAFILYVEEKLKGKQP